MRWTKAGLFLLLILFGTTEAAHGQATGEVQSIGFNGAFRPDCWVPMVVRLKPDVAEAGNYQIQVFQHDLDGDRAAYVRNITLNGNATAAEQLFWMYFLPQPTNHGLPDQTSGTLRDLQKELVVFLCDAKGKAAGPVAGHLHAEQHRPEPRRRPGRPPREEAGLGRERERLAAAADLESWSSRPASRPRRSG